MARAKAVEEIEELDEEFEENVPVNFDESLTIAIKHEPEKKEGIRVPVFLPRLEDGDGMKVDQYEHVTIANERGETCYKVLRGERVEVPISVFMVLKEKYPKL